jgi:cytoskeletal protein RodZ
MSEPAPPGRPRSHRASSGARLAAGRLAAPLTALGVVVIVIALLIWINGRSGNSSNSAGSPPSQQPTAAAAPTPSVSPSDHHRPKPKRSAHPRHTPSAHHSSHHTPAPSKSSSAAPVFAPVDVLNNSRIKGLAHHVAAEVEGRGWTISHIGNLRGRVAESTLYFPPGGLAAAQHLAGEFGSIQRILPQSEGGLHSPSLVLVVTRFWTD